jgi:DNA-binding PadR family transcriptional regulator
MAKVLLKHHVLFVIADAGRELYGIEIIRAAVAARGSSVNPKTMYSTLADLAQEGLLESRVEASDHAHGGNRRRYYKLTQAGETLAYEIRSRQPPAA